jgi:hypothetical protein
MTRYWAPLALLLAALIPALMPARAQEPATDPAPFPRMSFFVTSRGRGLGANFGGIAGADAHCRQLAAAVGRGDRVWRAYLSVPAWGDAPAVNARDRIGKGPWFNAAGVPIAAGLDDLHGDDNAIGKETALSEKGTAIAPGRHDILTGSNPDGTLAGGREDTTCQAWTSYADGRAMVGHVNRSGGGQRPTSWNSAHASRGCSQRALRASMGDGLIYCFAAD